MFSFVKTSNPLKIVWPLKQCYTLFSLHFVKRVSRCKSGFDHASFSDQERNTRPTLNMNLHDRHLNSLSATFYVQNVSMLCHRGCWFNTGDGLLLCLHCIALLIGCRNSCQIWAGKIVLKQAQRNKRQWKSRCFQETETLKLLRCLYGMWTKALLLTWSKTSISKML